MQEVNMFKAKKQARKKAWYDAPRGIPYNPFKRNRACNTPQTNNGFLNPEVGITGASRHASEPARSARRSSKEDATGIFLNKSNDHFTEKAANENVTTSGPESHTDDPSSNTVASSRLSGRRTIPREQYPQEQSTRQRFIGKFRKQDHGNDIMLEHKKPHSTKSPTNYTVQGQLKATIFNSWTNVLMLAVLVSFTLNLIDGIPDVAVFVVNFIAIIPLAVMLSGAIEGIVLRGGEKLGGLLAVLYDNAAELIVFLLALAESEVLIVHCGPGVLDVYESLRSESNSIRLFKLYSVAKRQCFELKPAVLVCCLFLHIASAAPTSQAIKPTTNATLTASGAVATSSDMPKESKTLPARNRDLLIEYRNKCILFLLDTAIAAIIWIIAYRIYKSYCCPKSQQDAKLIESTRKFGFAFMLFFMGLYSYVRQDESSPFGLLLGLWSASAKFTYHSSCRGAASFSLRQHAGSVYAASGVAIGLGISYLLLPKLSQPEIGGFKFDTLICPSIAMTFLIFEIGGNSCIATWRFTG